MTDDLLARSLSPGDLPDPGRSLELLGLAQGGDRDALNQLIERYRDRLRRIVRVQLGASSLREATELSDIVQSTFRAALPAINGIRPRTAAGLIAWLAEIAANRIRDGQRYRFREKRDARCELPGGADESPGLALPSRAPTPDKEVELAEIQDLIDAEVERLPDSQRQVVLLRAYCGEEWDAIAAAMHRGVPAVKMLYQRAKIPLQARLRQVLRDGSE